MVATTGIGRETGAEVTVETTEISVAEDTIEMTAVAEEVAGEIVTSDLNGRKIVKFFLKYYYTSLGSMIEMVWLILAR